MEANPAQPKSAPVSVPVTEIKTPAPVPAAVPAEVAHSAQPAPDSKADKLVKDANKQIANAETAPKVSTAKAPKPANGSHTGMAITATVIIVISLSALAVYAYLQSPK